MKKLLFVLFVGFFVSVGQARADMSTPFNYTKSFDGSSKLLYRTVNTLFGLEGSSALTGNQQLYENFSIENPGTIAATDARMFALNGTYSDKSVFSVLGDSGSSLLSSNSLFGGNGDITQFYNNPSLLGDNGYTGDLSFRIDNSNGIFYSDAVTNANINKLGSDRTTDAEINHFLYFDVTSMINDVYGDLLGFEFTNAYLVGFEDRSYYVNGNLNSYWDGDYNDGLFLVFNNDGGNTTPEPASFLIFGTGLAGLALVRRRRLSKNA